MKTLDRIAVVGGGLSGLSAGIALLRQGRSVVLFEANDRLGGCCTATQMEGFTFNDGALYVALPELPDHCFERLGLDRASVLPLRQITAVQTSRMADGTVVTFRHGGHIEVARAGGPRPLTNPDLDVQRLLDKWRTFLELLTQDVIVRPFSLSRLLWKGWRELPKLRGTVADELNRMVADPAVRAAMGSVTLYTGLPPDKTPAMQIIGLIAMLADKFYLPEGGMGRIPDVLAAEFLRLGGDVHLDAPVRRIVVDGGRVSAIELDRGERVIADAVVCTTSAMTTYTSLLEARDVPAAMRRKVASAPLSQKALSLQLGLRNKVAAESHFMGCIPALEKLNELLQPTHGRPRWLSYTVPTVTMPELAPPGASVIEVYPPIDQSTPVQNWTRAEAERIAEDTIELLSQFHQMEVAVSRLRSPREFQSDLHLFGGAIYGLSPAADARAQFPHRSPIAGLYHAGQTTYPGYGVGPAMLSGMFAADAVN